VLYNENLAKYTPYRLQIGSLGWRATPAEAAAALGPPTEVATPVGESFTMTWSFPESSISMVFGIPRPPRPPVLADQTAMLLLVRLSRSPDTPEQDSDSMNQ
jgi:hypothetical protein